MSDGTPTPDRPDPLPDPVFDYDSDKKQPWWNDADKVSGLATTTLMLVVLAVFVIVAIGGTLKWVTTWFQ